MFFVSDFMVRLFLSLLISLLLIAGFRFRAERSNLPADRLPGLKPAALAVIVFFAGCFIFYQAGLAKTMLEFDPALPLWMITEIFRVFLLTLIGLRLFSIQNRQISRLPEHLFFILVGLSLMAQTMLFIPASFLVKGPRTDRNGIVMQTLAVTCVPTVLANISHLYGLPMSEAEATAKAGTLWIGSLVTHSIIACRRMGFHEAAYSKKPLQQVLEENLPFIITIGTGVDKVEHAAGVIGWIEGRIHLADPLQGLVECGVEELASWPGLAIIRLGPKSDSQRQALLSDFSPADLKKH